MKISLRQPLDVVVGTLMTVGMVGSASAQATRAELMQFTGALAGTAVATTISVSGAGHGILFPLKGTSTLGDLDVTGYAELSPNSQPADCNGQTGESHQVTVAAAVIRLKTDLMYWHLSNGTACVVPAAGVSMISVDGKLLGGTGQYQQVSGDLSFAAQTDGLVTDAQGNSFGGVTAQFTGNLQQLTTKKY